MLREISAENRTAILQLTRSGIVCLDIIRSRLGPTAKLHTKVKKNIDQLLLDEKYAAFRTEFLLSLDVPTALLFIKHYSMYKNLPPATRNMLKDLLDALHRYEEPFLLQLSSLLENEEQITRNAVEHLLQNIIADDEPCSKYPCFGYAYGYGCGYGKYGYGYGYSGYGFVCTPDTTANFSDLQDERLLELYQAFNRGIVNAEQQTVQFKPGQRFTADEGRAIIFRMQDCSGTKHEQMFRAVAHEAIRDSQILTKLRVLDARFY